MQVMAEIEDRHMPGGWMVRASALGGLVQTFYVYELDDKKAAALARTAVAVTDGERVDTVKLLSINELEDHGLQPGELKRSAGGSVSKEIKVPEISGTGTKLSIGRWFKRVGDPVTVHEPLVEIDTDNVTHELRTGMDPGAGLGAVCAGAIWGNVAV